MATPEPGQARLTDPNRNPGDTLIPIKSWDPFPGPTHLGESEPSPGCH